MAQLPAPETSSSRSGCVWGGVAPVHVSVGGVLFALVAWQLLGCWGISLSCWLGLSGPVWEVEAIRILRHEHILSSRPAGTLGPTQVGREGWGYGWHRASLEGPHQGPGVGLCGRGGCWLGVPRKILRQCPLHFQWAQTCGICPSPQPEASSGIGGLRRVAGDMALPVFSSPLLPGCSPARLSCPIYSQTLLCPPWSRILPYRRMVGGD